LFLKQLITVFKINNHLSNKVKYSYAIFVYALPTFNVAMNNILCASPCALWPQDEASKMIVDVVL
jgi:hypothetical protein